MSLSKPKCPCIEQQEGKASGVGIFSIHPKLSQDSSKVKTEIQRKFFMGNGFVTTNYADAANRLLKRDHKLFLKLLNSYCCGDLGAYFVPSVFFSQVPKVIDFGADYDNKYESQVKGQIAEEKVFKELKDYFDGTKDDVLVLHSHKFLDNKSNNEKDFIILNLSKGYILVIEVKASSSKYSKAKPQLLDSKERIEEIVGNLYSETKWKFAGIFIAQFETEKELYDCEKCNVFQIIGIENIAKQLTNIEKEILENHENDHGKWTPGEHVTEFVELAKQLMFIAQGDKCAPVTESSEVNKIGDQVNAASTFESLMFWTREQLSITQALEMLFVFLDAFYSTGKTASLKHVAKHWDKQKKTVHFFIHRAELDEEELKQKLPFTLMVEYEFRNARSVQIVETTFRFEDEDSLEPFLKKFQIESDHYVCFDEVICKRYSKAFTQGLKNMKDQVAGLWVAIGAKSVTGRFAINSIEKAGFVCPRFEYPLRNPLQIAQYSHNVSQEAHKNNFDTCLQNPITILSKLNINEGKLLLLDEIYSSCLKALEASLQKLPFGQLALIYIDDETKSEATVENIKKSFGDRPEPCIFSGSKSVDSLHIQMWLCEPSKRRNDLCIVTMKHNSNGLETKVVVYILPEACEECGHSNEDPVIASRATAMLIVARYKRSNCPNCQPDQPNDIDQQTISKTKALARVAAQEFIFAVGGLTIFGGPSSAVEVYDPIIDRWKEAEAMPTPRQRVGVAVMKNQLYAIGGFNGTEDLNTVEVFDSVTKRWSQVASMNFCRRSLGAVTMGKFIYVCGGFNGISSLDTAHLCTVERYDPNLDEWKTIASMNTSRSGPGVVHLDGKLYALGGTNGTSILKSVEYYDPRTAKWEFGQPMLSKRYYHGAAVLNGKIYAIGGYNGSSYLNYVEVFDPIRNKWSYVSPLKVARSNLTVVATMDRLYAIGGFDEKNNLSTVEMYNPDTNEWSFVASMKVPRAGVAAGVIQMEE